MIVKADYYEELQLLIEELKKFKIQVEFYNEASEFADIGELVNRKILLNSNTRDNLSLIFIIGHLFGHYVQFHQFEKYKNLVETVLAPKPLILSDEFKQSFFEYELEAFRIGKYLIQKKLPFTKIIETKYQVFLNTDFDLFWKYLTTGKKTSAEDFKNKLELNELNVNKNLIPIEPLSYKENFSFLNNIDETDFLKIKVV